MLLRLFFGGLYLNKGVLARFRHGLLHLNCSWHWWWLLNPKATTGPGLGNAAMTDQKPKHMFFGNSPLNTVAIVIFFDFQKSVLLIPSTKTDTPRTIPLSTDAVSVLREQLRASQSRYEGVIPLHEPLLFSNSPNGVTGGFLKLCRKIGIEDLRFHDLRHEATSRLFEKGLNPVEVATITGHKDTRMLIRYTHLRAEDLVGRLG